MASIPSGVKKSKVVNVNGIDYLCENYRNKGGSSRWRTKLKCVNCEKERYVELRTIMERVNGTGLCRHCNWEKIGMESNTKFKNGKNHPRYKGGKFVNSQGYINLLLEIDDPFYSMKNNGGYALEHRYIVAKSLGRLLKETEHIHHLNGNKTDNRIENLVLLDGGIHNIVTALEQKIKKLEEEVINLKNNHA